MPLKRGPFPTRERNELSRAQARLKMQNGWSRSEPKPDRTDEWQVICLTAPETMLVQRCKRRDSAAFDEVVSQYKTRIHSYISRMLGGSEDAEDLTLEVFVRMYQGLDSFRSEASLNTWLFRIADNLCIDHFRRNQKHRAIAYSLDEPLGANGDESGPGREIADTGSEPYRALANLELSERLEQAIGALPDKLRAVLILHDVEDVPYEEIARIVACPLGTVKSRLFNARVQLRQTLSGYLAE